MELLPLLERLVSIDSVNPGLGGPGEAEIAAFVAEWAAEAGLEVELDEAAPGRPNVIATARGSGGGKTLLLNAHLDTVGFGAMADPLVPRVQAGRLYGRGAYDMKGGLAACLVAAAEAARRGLRGDVVVTAVVDEELSSVGTQMALKRVRPDAAIVAEPTGMRVCIAHKGFVAFEVETHGRAAHGSRPDLGVDAIAKMGHVLVGLDALDRSLRERPTHPLLGSGSLHAGVVAGGIGVLDLPRPLPAPGRAPDGARRGPLPGRVGAPGPARPAPPRRRRLQGDVAGRRRAPSVRGLADEEIVRLVGAVRGRGRARSARRTGRTRR